MKLINRRRRLKPDLKLTLSFLLAMTCFSCKSPSVKIANDSFCEGKYKPIYLKKQDFVNLKSFRQSHQETADKMIKHISINQREFKQCP